MVTYVKYYCVSKAEMEPVVNQLGHFFFFGQKLILKTYAWNLTSFYFVAILFTEWFVLNQLSILLLSSFALYSKIVQKIVVNKQSNGMKFLNFANQVELRKSRSVPFLLGSSRNRNKQNALQYGMQHSSNLIAHTQKGGELPWHNIYQSIWKIINSIS